ncbi:MAG: hypothetical protein AAF074_01365 [Pseudomonadota bacterium]
MDIAALRARYERKFTARGRLGDLARAAGFVGLYAVFAALPGPLHPVVMTLLVVVLGVSLRFALTDAELRAHPAAGAAALLTVLGVAGYVASLNDPLAMQRLLTFGPLLLFVCDALAALGARALAARGEIDDRRAFGLQRSLSALSSLALAALNEAALMAGSDWGWVAAMALGMLVLGRLFAWTALRV